MLKLSLLEVIPLPLAEKISEVDDIGERLRGLAKSNFFVRILDENGTVFRFHHLFQEFL